MAITIYILCFAFTIIVGFFRFKESVILQFLSVGFLLILLICFVLSIVYLKRSWKIKRWHALLPLLVCCIAFFTPFIVGTWARNTYFHSVIPQLESEIHEYQISGKYPKSSWNGYAIHPYRMENENIKVIYWWGGGFPVKHTALAYCSSDDPEECFRDGGWRGYAIDDHWWVIKD